MKLVSDYFGCMVFDDKVMQERLSPETYRLLKRTSQDGRSLNLSMANEVAAAMKDWAIGLGATHYTHWFQPMTGITAEKHDSFICPDGEGGVIMNFSGKELIKGESDASSFPNGGLRSTFEARGYTAWDPSCDAFVKDGALCIPTAFCSYSGQVLDKKTPLLRSTNALAHQAQRLLACFGKKDAKVQVTVGAEQEYFLIDKEYYLRRKDLIFTGRTLFGAKPPKGQELEDHYYGSIRPRVIAFMADLDEQLWKLGIPAKTRHNEAAPAQHELAPVYTVVNVAADHNQLTMEFMKKIADRHGLTCLLHEKPFAGVNGSGKHDNWSISIEGGENLLSPGKNPQDNLQFLVFLCAVIAAVDDHQDLLRLSVASAGNDHRLGASEAPPAIISMYLGDELTAILDAIANDAPYDKRIASSIDMHVNEIPAFMQDTTDRNRTSPFAFTGNKFEFRMLGSSTNISCPNVMINTAVAEKLDELATALSKTDMSEKEVKRIIKESYLKHKRIVFNGNGYSEEWEIEAGKRGLLNLKCTPEALLHYTDEKNVALMAKYGVYTQQEIAARRDILLDNYNKIIAIEAHTMSDIVSREIIPAAVSYMDELSRVALQKSQLKVTAITEKALLCDITEIVDKIAKGNEKLINASYEAKTNSDAVATAMYYRDYVLPAMKTLRENVDKLETKVGKDYWPVPTYSELLFSV